MLVGRKKAMASVKQDGCVDVFHATKLGQLGMTSESKRTIGYLSKEVKSTRLHTTCSTIDLSKVAEALTLRSCNQVNCSILVTTAA